MSGIVDSHVHLLPSPLAERVRTVLAPHVPGPLVYPLEEDELLDRLVAEGLTTAWSLPYAHKPGVAAWLNPAMAALTDRLAAHPLELVAGATVHPADDDPGDLVVEAVRELGARVLKLHCSVGAYDIDDARLEPVWAVCEELRLPVVVHVGHSPTGHTHAPDFDGLEDVLSRHEELALIVAHAGHPATGSLLELMERHANLHADLTPVVIEHVDLQASDLERLDDRLLFGSDAPNTGITVTDLLEHLRSSGLSPDSHAAITGGNAARLTAAVVSS